MNFDDDNEGKCPYCGDNQGGCEHFLASLSVGSPGDGQYGIGLGGGTMFDVDEIGSVFRAVCQQVAVEALGKHPEYVSKQYEKLPEADSASLKSLMAVARRIETRLSAKGEESVWQLAEDIEVELDSTDRIDFLSGLMNELGCHWTPIDYVVNESSGTWSYESWYVHDAASTADVVQTRLQALLPAQPLLKPPSQAVLEIMSLGWSREEAERLHDMT